jgi:group I intron endonuclease
MVGIYKITSPSNKINIGQSWNIEQRKNTYSQLGCKGQTKLYNSLQKYGWKQHKFDIIHELPEDVTQEVLNQYEILYWQQYKDYGFDMLNIREPGSKGKLSDETKQKLRIPRSEQTKLKQSLAHKGKKHSIKHIENLKKSKIGKGGKQIICVNDGNIFETLKAASLYYKINTRSIQNITSGLNKQTRNKLIFKFK